MKAIFVVDFPPEISLPSLFAEGELQLAYTDTNGDPRGGWSCVGQVPQAPTCVVCIETNAATMGVLKADARYLFVEDL